MTGTRAITLAVAQMGPVHLRDSRENVVARLIDLMREAKGRGAEFVVFPELALTTFLGNTKIAGLDVEMFRMDGHPLLPNCCRWGQDLNL